MSDEQKHMELPELVVDVIEAGNVARPNAVACELERHIKFDTGILRTFASTKWETIVYDALVVAAAVEFCDRRRARREMVWGRKFRVYIPVHDPDRWRDAAVLASLVDALNLLTGDAWHFVFRARRKPAQPPAQDVLEFPVEAEAVIAYSEGMDSRAVYGLERLRLGERLVRVRVGSKPRKGEGEADWMDRCFTALPYSVKLDKRDNDESSLRSRGFKFSMVAALAAYLVHAPSIILPESGQGALAPAILPVGQAHPDYRNHPFFTAKMAAFVNALLGHQVTYRFPRLWSTKGETLREFVDRCREDARWAETRSCWQKQRQVAVAGDHRQCGICAACMLRRLSVHAAGLEEPAETYVWESLRTPTFKEGAAADFELFTDALEQYAVAGALHFEHLAQLQDSYEYALIKRTTVGVLARALNENEAAVKEGLDRLVRTHAAEWAAFKDDLGADSFIRKMIG